MSTAVAERSPAADQHRAGEELSHKEILEVMVGLLAALFTALISSTIVSTALPTIMAQLHGTQRQYTWVITASLLAMTISTPILGKLADLINKKLLIQASIILFVLGSIGAGVSQEIWQMMVARAAQGVAMGGLTAMTQAIMGTIIAPRQRGRYTGYMGAVMAVATISGPLVGGWITDSWNWRWVFFVCVPLAVIALFLLQTTLKLPQLPKRKVRIDVGGAFFLAITAAAPMLWVTFAGKDYDWISWESAAFAATFVVAALVALIIELRHPEPIVPIRVLKNSTTALMIIAGMAVGVGMFGAGTFLTQYFQLGAGYTPTKAGLMTLPMIGAQLVSSVVGGQIVSRTGRWKPIMILGGFLLVGGFVGLGIDLDHATPYWHTAIWMAVAGIGVGCLIQNIVLAVQNTVDVKDIGASSATISFFRSLGGAVGVSVLGAVLADKVETRIIDGVKALGPAGAQAAGKLGGGAGNLNIEGLPAPIRTLIHNAYADTFGLLFLIAGIAGIGALIAVLLVREVPLRTTVAMQPKVDAGGASAQVSGSEAVATMAAPVTDGKSSGNLDTKVNSNGIGIGIGIGNDNGNGSGPNVPELVTKTGSGGDADRNPAIRAETGGPMTEPSPGWDPAGLDDPAERVSVAALDVLAAAQDRARAQEALGHEKVTELLGRLDQLSHEVDAAIGAFHRQMQQIREELLSAEPGRRSPAPDGVGGDGLRQYEYNLLLDSQQTADRVTRLARAEAERTLDQAEQERAELQKRIDQLRNVEREITDRISTRLRTTPVGED
ncbi:MDR family MFS transporter [Microlunatus sp. Gsoil 973]|uniref:MDR family MFS transporter n=1 Tax=Microlunatus sp. Gsoil 973 TaxID=2672569 RepID=UPI0012B487DD|nr:MDR family MFS transporter [Microlunatus sp. Gsoil 973]QGN32728.1 MFS transporter [Microlunatus sp. Gsoil 973]